MSAGGWVTCRVCLTSTICTYCTVCDFQTPGSFQPVFLLVWTRPLPVLWSPSPSLAEHLALAAPWQTLVIREWELYVRFSFTLVSLCAEISTGFSKCDSYHSVIKCSAHSTPTGEEGRVSLRWQACMGDNMWFIVNNDGEVFTPFPAALLHMCYSICP